MNKQDEALLEANGWSVLCDSPFEIELVEDGERLGFASGEAAEIVLASLKPKRKRTRNLFA